MKEKYLGSLEGLFLSSQNWVRGTPKEALVECRTSARKGRYLFPQLDISSRRDQLLYPYILGREWQKESWVWRETGIEKV